MALELVLCGDRAYSAAVCWIVDKTFSAEETVNDL